MKHTRTVVEYLLTGRPALVDGTETGPPDPETGLLDPETGLPDIETGSTVSGSDSPVLTGLPDWDGTTWPWDRSPWPRDRTAWPWDRSACTWMLNPYHFTNCDPSHKTRQNDPLERCEVVQTQCTRWQVLSVQCFGAVESLATPSGDERLSKSADVGETTDEGTTSGEHSLAAAVAVVGVSGEHNLPVLALCTGLRTLSALRKTVISYTSTYKSVSVC